MSTAVQAVPRPNAGAALADILAYQRALVDTGQYEYLGRMKRVVLEAEEGARTQAAAVTSKLGHCLEWYDQRHPKGGTIRNYVPIGQSPDRKMILALEPILKRDLLGRLTPEVGLPDLPDPTWKPGQAWGSTSEYEALVAKGFNPLDPPMVAQNLNQLSDKIVAGTNFLVFQPVVQVLFQPEINQVLQATYWTLLCSYDAATQTHPALLIDRVTGAAHFYGGKFEVVPVG